VGSERFPPLKTISNTNLPRPASSFVGRERERQEVTELLQNGARLLTLSGPGGSGKTRLSIEAATQLVDAFKEGVFWVPLATIRDAALVTETIAETLGAKVALHEHIGERQMLLLIDNLEQVIEAAPELAALVEACPNLRVLCTSRERLRVRGEVEYAVPPLSESEAVSLFCHRSQLAANNAIDTLCLRLDCLPLAIELAAARTSVLSPDQILERLAKRLDLLKGGRDAEARQQTLRAAILWSYELLNGEEQRLFARLAVFRGGCTFEAAEEVADADLDTLQSLVDKSLLRHSNERFWMLETIREYALERVDAGDDGRETRERLVTWICTLVDKAAPHLREYDHEWMKRIEREHANLRAALDHLEAAGETQRALQIAAGAFWYWAQYGHMNEGRDLLDRLLRDRRPTPARAKALLAQADLAVDDGDAEATDAAAAEASALCGEFSDEWGLAYALLLRGLGRSVAEEWDAGRHYIAQAVERFRKLGDDYYTIESRRRLAWMYQNLGDLVRSRAMHEENLRMARTTGRASVVATTLSVLSGYALDDGRIDDALAMSRESISTHWGAGDIYHTLVGLHRFARAFILRGQPEQAVKLLAARASLHQQHGLRVEGWLAAYDRENSGKARILLDGASFAQAWDSGKKLTLGEAVAFALETARDE
jgi:predicted ATPase